MVDKYIIYHFPTQLSLRLNAKSDGIPINQNWDSSIGSTLQLKQNLEIPGVSPGGISGRIQAVHPFWIETPGRNNI